MTLEVKLTLFSILSVLIVIKNGNWVLACDSVSFIFRHIIENRTANANLDLFNFCRGIECWLLINCLKVDFSFCRHSYFKKFLLIMAISHAWWYLLELGDWDQRIVWAQNNIPRPHIIKVIIIRMMIMNQKNVLSLFHHKYNFLLYQDVVSNLTFC